MSERVISTTRGDRIADVHGGDAFDPDDFYAKHRGGSGNVVVVFADVALPVEAQPDERSKFAIFGSIEKAQEWAFTLGDDWHCVFCPFVVDEPDFGNATNN